jgi:small ligand-binding sensory domain FIST
MSKKKVRRKLVGADVDNIELNNRREQQQLRRLRDQQRRITDLSRALRRATRQADVARLDAARELCAETGYGVFGLEEWDKLNAAVDELEREVREYRDERTVREEAAAAATV